MTAPEWAARVGYYPTRRGYTYLNRYRKWDLLGRRKVGRQFLYFLTPKGKARIAWLLRASDDMKAHVIRV
jgi:hypothetical protein